MSIKEIIDQVWEENKDKFSSRKELEIIVNTYFLSISFSLKAGVKELHVEGLGTFKMGYKDFNAIEKIKAKKAIIVAKKQKGYVAKYNRRVVNAWTRDFVDENFPD